MIFGIWDLSSFKVSWFWNLPTTTVNQCYCPLIIEVLGMSNIMRPNVKKQKLVTRYVMIDTTRPALIKSPIRKLIKPATTALGGVPAGIINAMEQFRVAGIMRNNGCTFNTFEISAKIGSNILASVMFEVNSVKMLATKAKISITLIGDRTLSPFRCSPTNEFRPVSLHALERANPPPSKNRRPHGIFSWAVFHGRRGEVD